MSRYFYELSLSLSLFASFSTSCVKQKCELEEFQQEAACQEEKDEPEVTVDSVRWSITQKDTTNFRFRASDGSSLKGKKFTLSSDGTTASVELPPLDSEGKVSVDLLQLSAQLKPGPATITTDTGKKIPGRLFRRPAFDGLRPTKEITPDLKRDSKALRRVRSVGLLTYSEGTSPQTKAIVLEKRERTIGTETVSTLSLSRYPVHGNDIENRSSSNNIDNADMNAYVVDSEMDMLGLSSQRVATIGMASGIEAGFHVFDLVTSTHGYEQIQSRRIASLTTDLSGSLYAGILDGEVKVLLSGAKGTVQDVSGDSANKERGLVLMGDLNGDGRADLVSWGKDGANPAVFLQDSRQTVSGGAPLFAKAEFGVPPLTPIGPSKNLVAALGDLDEDGLPDFLVATSTTIQVFYNDGKSNVEKNDGTDKAFETQNRVLSVGIEVSSVNNQTGNRIVFVRDGGGGKTFLHVWK